MKKIILISLFVVLFSFLVFLVIAQEEHDFEKTKELIDSGISCNKLSNEQLEEIGDYYMEQMHPGEAHEIMDKMMGGEGSGSLKQVHINIARMTYCNENTGGMMAGGGMMGNNYQNPQYYNSSYYGLGFETFFYVILILVIIVLIFGGILLINKSRNQKKRKRKIRK